MTEEQIAFALTEQFLPQFTLCNPDQNSRAPAHVEQIPQYTQAAMTIFDDPTRPITIWGYSSAFNPLAFVETILPPNLHYLLQSGQFLIDPTRTILTQAPVFFDLNSESAQLKILAAYGHPNRWLKSSRDLKRYLYDSSSTIPASSTRSSTISPNQSTNQSTAFLTRRPNTPNSTSCCCAFRPGCNPFTR